MSQRVASERPRSMPGPVEMFDLGKWARFLHKRYPGKTVAVVDGDKRQVYAFDTIQEAMRDIEQRGIGFQRVTWVAVPPADQDWPSPRRTSAPGRPWT